MTMAMTGMLPMVGMLIGMDNAAVGLAVHLVNSAVIGALFALLTTRPTSQIGPLLGTGLGYGFAWWVLGALLIMPLWLSVTAEPAMRDMIFQVGPAQWWSLAGHLLYDLLTADVLYGLSRRATS
ncbi:putative membrane protein YagU involved in acid resistance [Pseudonocardia eucalypti]|nr:putative membrane protein YagU involved in acid resistance [Pseudonocardia eucalypti]